MQVPFLDLKAQHEPIQAEINSAIANVFARNAFILGDEVRQFEEKFADYCGVSQAVGLDSGLSALKLALEALGVGPGDEVIVPANTFIATAAAVSFVGAKVVFVDMAADSTNIDPDLLEAAITERTKAVIPVHLYGIPADMDRICDIARRRHLFVIEDACQAHGALYKGKPVGSFGHAAAFSFYPGKNLGAAGDAGALVTNSRDLADMVRAMRNCGQREKYHHVTSPHNHRLDTLQAAVLSIKLDRLPAWNEARRANADLYTRLLEGVDVATPQVPPDVVPVWHLYVIRSERRDPLKDHLTARGIATGLHYPLPLHLQPYYRHLGYRRGDFPNTERCAEELLSLPMYAELSSEAIGYVADAIREFATVPQAAT
ncbi:MAG: DegT/DnrJ/EryC1/StrS family aminotransferase [Chloroflexi bacterium]|nr:DegT/DnrJ/EryC1/StrS family aminotransferase [Chloroflexota bacterium]